MGDYFKLWRRKIGVVTLVVACVFAVGWVRSQFVEDGIYFCPFNGLSVFVESANQSLFGAVYLDLKNRSFFADAFCWKSSPSDSSSGGRRHGLLI